MERSYCEFCNDFVEYEKKLVKEKRIIDGIEVEYKKIKTYCKECKNEIFVNEVLDKNVLELQRVYREKIGIITVDKIEKIVDMYGIGKRNLSKLLGFGEITLTRYMELDMPTRLYSDVLFSVMDYNQMLMLALDNKDKVSEKVYNKLIENIKVLIESENQNKLVAVSKYIVSETKDITNLAVQKLLYFCQLVSYAINNKPMFMDTCEAWKFGPVYTPIYYRLNKYTYDPISAKEFDNFEVINLDEQDKKIIDAVINTFGMLSGSKLRDISHKTEPWQQARKGLGPEDNSNEIIKNKSIKEYVKTLEIENNDANEFCIKYMQSLI